MSHSSRLRSRPLLKIHPAGTLFRILYASRILNRVPLGRIFQILSSSASSRPICLSMAAFNIDRRKIITTNAPKITSKGDVTISAVVISMQFWTHFTEARSKCPGFSLQYLQQELTHIGEQCSKFPYFSLGPSSFCRFVSSMLTNPQ